MQTGKFSQCSDEMVTASVIEGNAWYALRRVLQLLDAMQVELEEKTTNLDSIRGKKIKQLEAESNVLKSERLRQYEAYAEGIIKKEEYLNIKQQITSKMNNIQSEIEMLTHLSEEEEAYKNKVTTAVELLDGEMQHEKITQELADTTIDTVYVYNKKRIEVVFKFDDILMKAIEEYQKGEKIV